jgi:hypothetical protein
MTTCSVGTPGSRRSLGRAGAEYLSHNIVIGSVVAMVPPLRGPSIAPPLRAAPASVWPCAPATVLGRAKNGFFRVLSLRACASTPATPSPYAVLTTQAIRYCATNIRPARLVPVTPPAFPTSQFEIDGRRKGICRFAGEVRCRRHSPPLGIARPSRMIRMSLPRATVRGDPKRRLREWAIGNGDAPGNFNASTANGVAVFAL